MRFIKIIHALGASIDRSENQKKNLIDASTMLPGDSEDLVQVFVSGENLNPMNYMKTKPEITVALTMEIKTNLKLNLIDIEGN